MQLQSVATIEYSVANNIIKLTFCSFQIENFVPFFHFLTFVSHVIECHVSVDKVDVCILQKITSK